MPEEQCFHSVLMLCELSWRQIQLKFMFKRPFTAFFSLFPFRICYTIFSIYFSFAFTRLCVCWWTRFASDNFSGMASLCIIIQHLLFSFVWWYRLRNLAPNQQTTFNPWWRTKWMKITTELPTNNTNNIKILRWQVIPSVTGKSRFIVHHIFLSYTINCDTVAGINIR